MRVVAKVLALTLLASPALVPSVHAQPAAPLSSKDKRFLTQDVRGGAYELAIALLAQKLSARDDVKAYAAKLVADHTTYNQALQDLGHTKGLNVPAGMTATESHKVKSLGNLTGDKFDRAFIKEAVRLNDQDKKGAEAETRYTKDADIKAFLAKFAAMDSEHETMAKALQR